MVSFLQNSHIRHLMSQWYPAKRALPAMLTHGRWGPFGRIPSISPVGVQYGISPIWENFDLYSASVTAVMLAISCHIGPHYYGPQLCFHFNKHDKYMPWIVIFKLNTLFHNNATICGCYKMSLVQGTTKLCFYFGGYTISAVCLLLSWLRHMYINTASWTPIWYRDVILPV